MKSKMLLLLSAALIVVPFIAVAGLLYAGASIPIGTFRSVEKEKAAIVVTEAGPAPSQAASGGLTAIQSTPNRAAIAMTDAQSVPYLATNGVIQIQSDQNEKVRQATITGVNENGTVHVNNLA